MHKGLAMWLNQMYGQQYDSNYRQSQYKEVTNCMSNGNHSHTIHKHAISQKQYAKSERNTIKNVLPAATASCSV